MVGNTLSVINKQETVYTLTPISFYLEENLDEYLTYAVAQTTL